MVPVVTTKQMRVIDKRSINSSMAAGYSYMLKAGIGIIEAIDSLDLNPDTDEIAIVCGHGNNGGDGYVTGRLLLDKGYKVLCFGVSDEGNLNPDARLAFDEYIQKEGHYFRIDDATDLEGFGRFSLIVDALLGIGIKGDPRGLFGEIIKMINASGKTVISVDTPSGLDNDTGIPGTPTVSATITVSMGFPKFGQLFYPGRSYCGKLFIKDLGYPTDIVDATVRTTYLPTMDELRQLVPARKPAGSKHDHGLILSVCGSRGMTGSCALVIMAALRSGCGMVHCAAPESIIPTLAVKCTEPVFHPLAETVQGTVAERNLDILQELSASMQALCIGPGLSHTEETVSLVRALVSSVQVPIVLDADGINAFKGYTETLKEHSQELIITPHKREWERLFGTVSAHPEQVIEHIKQIALQYHMCIVYKGSPTIVADTKGSCFVLPVGTSGMATAGSGDVLCGVITALLAQGAPASDAALLGASIHGFAGEYATEAKGEYSMIAGDIIDSLQRVFMKLRPFKNNAIIT